MSTEIPKGDRKYSFTEINGVNAITSTSTSVAKMRKQFEEFSNTPPEDNKETVPVRPLRRNQRLKSTNKAPSKYDAKKTATDSRLDAKGTSANGSSGHLTIQKVTEVPGIKSAKNSTNSLNSSSNDVPSVAERRKLFQGNFLQSGGNKKPNLIPHKPLGKLPKPAPRYVMNGERLAHPIGTVSQEEGVSPVIYKPPLLRITQTTKTTDPPTKPPRTFAHDIYISQKKLNNSDNHPDQVPKCTDKHPTSQNADKLLGISDSGSPYATRNLLLKASKNSATNQSGTSDSGPLYATSNLLLKASGNTATSQCSENGISKDLQLRWKPVPPAKPAKLSNGLPSQKISPYSVSPLTHMQHITVENVCYEPSMKPRSSCIDDLATGLTTPAKDHKLLRRSYSDEHIYSEPHDSLAGSMTSAREVLSEKTSPRDHHYMHIPVNSKLVKEFSSEDPPNLKDEVFDSPKQKKLLGPTIRDMINHSFSLLRCHLSKRDSVTEYAKADEKDDSGSEVSVRDLEERIIYVNSVKKKHNSNSSEKLQSDSHLFKLLILVNFDESGGGPQTILRFPKLQPSESEWAIIELLCFPDFENLTVTDPSVRGSMLFILCDEKGEKTYGHCLRFYKTSSSSQSHHHPLSLCLLSSIYAPTFYFQVLDELCNHLDAVKANWNRIVSNLRSIHTPSPGDDIYLPLQNPGSTKDVKLSRPLDLQLENAPVTRLLQLLDVDLLLKVVSSLLLERRVLLLSSSYNTLCQCCQAIVFLLYPFTWQHMVIPALPECLLSESCTLSPYLMGVFRQLKDKVCEMIEDQILIVDVDFGCSVREVGDENTILPGKIQRALETALNLAKNMTDPTETLRDIMISEAFVRMFVETVGHYSDFIIQKSEKIQTFQKEAFCKFPSSQSIQVFLQWFTETQMFEAFISECLHKKQHLLVLEEWKVLPLHSQLETCLFDRRALEYKEVLKGMVGLKNNLREFGLKVRNFGIKLRKALELE